MTKNQIKESLMREGLWREYVDIRENIKIEHPELDAKRCADMAYHEVFKRRDERRRFQADAKAERESDSDSIDVPELKIDIDESDMELVDPSIFDGKEKVDKRAAVEWVATKVRVQVKPEEAPDEFSWNLLQWVRSKDSNEDAFWLSMVKSLLPTKKQMEEDDRFSDDAREVTEILEKLSQAT